MTQGPLLCVQMLSCKQWKSNKSSAKKQTDDPPLRELLRVCCTLGDFCCVTLYAANVLYKLTPVYKKGSVR